MLILNSNVQNSRKERNYLDLLAIEETRKQSRTARVDGKPAGILGRFSRKMHF
ncbi:MAG: hypothetical protein M1442_02855 [Candidatus Thermoplasmatota archaeon]|nr:hypothetical protein [Candidatus Thermoplasmatota archaeon]